MSHQPQDDQQVLTAEGSNGRTVRTHDFPAQASSYVPQVDPKTLPMESIDHCQPFDTIDRSLIFALNGLIPKKNTLAAQFGFPNLDCFTVMSIQMNTFCNVIFRATLEYGAAGVSSLTQPLHIGSLPVAVNSHDVKSWTSDCQCIGNTYTLHTAWKDLNIPVCNDISKGANELRLVLAFPYHPPEDTEEIRGCIQFRIEYKAFHFGLGRTVIIPPPVQNSARSAGMFGQSRVASAKGEQNKKKISSKKSSKKKSSSKKQKKKKSSSVKKKKGKGHKHKTTTRHVFPFMSVLNREMQ
jgi:hypothetical protein